MEMKNVFRSCEKIVGCERNMRFVVRVRTIEIERILEALLSREIERKNIYDDHFFCIHKYCFK